MRSPLILSLLLVLVLAAYAAAPGEEPEIALAGTEWMLMAIVGADGKRDVLEGWPMVSLTFSEDELHGRMPCNLYGGNYVIEGEGIRFPQSLIQTAMWCSHPRPLQDRIYFDALEQVRRYELVGGRLILIGELARLEYVDSSGFSTPTPIPHIQYTDLFDPSSFPRRLRGGCDPAQYPACGARKPVPPQPHARRAEPEKDVVTPAPNPRLGRKGARERWAEVGADRGATMSLMTG